MANPRNLPECGVLLDPPVHDSGQFLQAHSRNSEIVTRRKTHHPADSLLCRSHQQAHRINLERRNLRQHRGVIVVKNVGFRIPRRLCSARAPIPRAQITAGIESDRARFLKLLHSPQPRALGPILAGAVLALSLAWTATFYFVVYPQVHGLYQEFLGDRVDLGRFLDNSSWDGRSLYVSLTYSSKGIVTPDTFRSIPVTFATAGKTSWTFLPFTAIGQLPAGARLAAVFDPKDRVTLPALAQRYPQGRVVYTLSLPERQWSVFLSDPTDPFRPGAVPPYSNW